MLLNDNIPKTRYLFSRSVTQVPLAEGKSVQQTVELLTRRLEQMGAEKQGTFYVDCETYHTAGANVGTTGTERCSVMLSVL